MGGTNGKGSVCALVYRALREAGFRVGLYTSPHLVDVRERVVVDDRPIPPEAFAQWTAAMLPTVEETRASFFEATTVIALADFAARGVDVAVVEVGLGGRLDATNVLSPLVAAITQIALDHTEYLGASLAEIAREKAGIAKRGRPLIIGETEPEIVKVLSTTAATLGARVVIVPREDRYEGPLGLAGSHQTRNAATARAVLLELPDHLRPPDDVVRRAFGAAWLPGRFDRRGKWIFDVAHNPSGFDVLVEALRRQSPRRPLHALVGILADKDWAAMLGRLSSFVDRGWLTDPPSAPESRRWNLAAVADVVGKQFTIQPDFDRALAEVQRDAATVLVTGSFHTVGDALARLPGFAPLG